MSARGGIAAANATVRRLASLPSMAIRKMELVGELVRYEDSYWLCYVRGPEGIIVELAEKID